MAAKRSRSHFLPNFATQQNNHEFEDIERFGRPLCEVPLFRSRLIPSTLAEQPEDRKMSDLSFSIFPSSYVRSDHSAELGHDELPPPASAISMRKHQNEPRLKSSSSSKHRRPRPHKSSSRKATVSCTCCPNKQRLCGLKLNDSTLSCEFCHVEETPKWREGPHGPRTLCNVCGLIYAKREERARSFLLAREFSLDSSSGTSSGSHSTSPTSNTLYTARHC
ncbi:GATA-type domain-containing protein [Fusarium acuminatum]|uniref:GATA-type domain-containing protein n=1 Tax=Fusarium acuminatum TaxID=5515 RepID=A0ABZ2XD31_9HYPO